IAHEIARPLTPANATILELIESDPQLTLLKDALQTRSAVRTSDRPVGRSSRPFAIWRDRRFPPTVPDLELSHLEAFPSRLATSSPATASSTSSMA
ncbi:unnamed protein product, partial [Nesidiocoris tenuis]